MKRLLTIFLAAVTACNNNNEQPVTQLDVPVQEKEMKDAIAKYPDSVLLRETLIQYYQDYGSDEMALTELNKTIQRDSSNPVLWDKKAQLLLEKKDTSGALRCFNKAIEIFPDPQYIMTAGWLYAQQKDSTALAMADALLLGKNAHAEKEALLIKGLYFSNKGNKEKALHFFDDCLGLDYNFMHAYREKAIVLYDLGKYNEAIEVLNKAVTLQNKFDEGYYWLGRCYEKLNNINEAIEQYHTAVFYNQDYVEAKDALAKLGVK
jgi:tetratricopeptide (TPR) repeat protein